MRMQRLIAASLAGLVTLGGSAFAQAAAPSSNPWADIAARDLHAVHDLLAENHPGPIDPENPAYRTWLESGLANGLAASSQAKNIFDYQRVVRAYVIGFNDDHTSLVPAVVPAYQEWPGILAALWPDGSIRVGVSDVPEVAVGDALVSCDGVPVAKLFEERVAPYRWNRQVASQKALAVPYLLQIDAGDEATRLHSCRVAHGEVSRDVALQWRRINGAEALALRRQADGRTIPELGLRQMNGVWLISLPTFQYQSDADVRRFKAFLEDVKAHLGELREAPRIVLDMRGNPGGVSEWGIQMAGLLWGERLVAETKAPFDRADVDWRASPSNLAKRQATVEWARRNKLPQESIDEIQRSVDGLKAALANHQAFARETGVVEATAAGPRPPSPPPLRGTVYLFTDETCASSCLDFVDVVRRLPRVMHVGRSTGADAVYIDVDDKPLPSGLMSLSYSMKVYRNRVRGNNVSYDPVVPWPGGQMSDDRLTRWAATLPRVAAP